MTKRPLKTGRAGKGVILQRQAQSSARTHAELNALDKRRELASDKALASAATASGAFKAPIKRAPATSAAPTRAQQMMIAEGLPAAAIIPPDQRRAAWANVIVRPMPRFDAPQKEEGEDTKLFRAQLEAQQRDTQQRKAKASPFLAAKRAARAAKPPRASREGMTTVADIAKQLKIIPRIARAALRAAKEAKPAQGWAFPADQVARIMKIINASLTPNAKVEKCKPSQKRSPKSNKPSRSSSAPTPTPPNSIKRTRSSKASAPKSRKSSSKGKRK